MDSNNNSVEGRGASRCRGTVHRVRRGDTLYSIARMYNVRVADIIRANPFVNIYNLQAGDELCIPTGNTGNNPPAGFVPYVVRPRDTLSSILRSTNSTYEELARFNQVLADLTVPAGTVLLVPAKIQPRS